MSFTVAVSAEKIAAMADRGVVVVSQRNEVVSLGRLVVAPPDQTESEWRVELRFATETTCEIVRIRGNGLDELANSWDGTLYHYSLPASQAGSPVGVSDARLHVDRSLLGVE